MSESGTDGDQESTFRTKELGEIREWRKLASGEKEKALVFLSSPRNLPTSTSFTETLN